MIYIYNSNFRNFKYRKPISTKNFIKLFQIFSNLNKNEINLNDPFFFS